MSLVLHCQKVPWDEFDTFPRKVPLEGRTLAELRQILLLAAEDYISAVQRNDGIENCERAIRVHNCSTWLHIVGREVVLAKERAERKPVRIPTRRREARIDHGLKGR